MLRIIATMLAVATIGAVVSGCGGGSSNPASSTDPDTIKPISNAQATAYANAVNLRAGDVLGMTMHGRPESEPANEKHSTQELNRCAGVASLEHHQLVDIRSPKFSRGHGQEKEEIGSGVSVMSSAAFATQELAAARSARGHACITRFAKRQFVQESSGQLHLGRVTTSMLRAPVAGIGGSFGFRVTVTVITSAAGSQLPFYIDFMGLVAGPAEIDLHAFSIVKPVSSTTERHLLLLLHSRAAATKL